MGQGFADGIGKTIALGVIILVILSFAVGVFATWFLPKLWIFLKPIIHAVTA
ncbi:MAG: hypothetical protein LLG40_15625 [Deltaproteobacteria bacterium]|nr:hypothetical protein [Deltaproteobacteria bacterium]